MSNITTPSSHQNNKTYKNSFHFRNDSGELDVFEAAKYFSSANNDQHPAGYNNINGVDYSARHSVQKGTARMSLDMPMMRSSNQIIPPGFHDQKQTKSENKKYKQPSSPGGRLASFLNSIFNQTSLKKKKSKSGSKDFDDENSPGGRRKRRSSISHFRITTTTTNVVANDNNNSKSLINASSKSGFATPPLNATSYATTPTKLSYKVISLADEKNGSFKTTLENEIYGDRKRGVDFSWIDEKKRIPGENLKNNLDFEFSNWKSSEEELRGFRKFSDDHADDDGGGDSDSSSDLFDLPNHELDFYSSGLPVYETTHMDRIKIVVPISRATTV